MTKQKWILLILCIGILWGTDTLFQNLWKQSNSKVSETSTGKQPKHEFKKDFINKRVAKKIARIKPVKLAYNQKGIKAVQDISAPSPSKKKTKKNDLEKLANSYDKKLAEKKKVVPTKKAKDTNKDQKQTSQTAVVGNNLKQNQRSTTRSDDNFFSNDNNDSSNGAVSIATPNPNLNADELSTSGGAFVREGEKSISQWEQTLTSEPKDSDVNDFISAIRSGEVDKTEAYKLVERLLSSESETNHSNAVKVIMSVKSEKSFILLTDIVSGGFSETVESAAYSGLLNYRSYDDLNIVESVLKKDNISLGAIYFSADTILQLSQQTITTYGEGQNRAVTMLQAYQDRFLMLSSLLKEVATGITDNYILTQVNQTVAYIGGTEAVADSSVVKPNYVF